MKSFLLGLALLGFVTNAQAQITGADLMALGIESSKAELLIGPKSGSMLFSGDFLIASTTQDGADTGSITICGGGGYAADGSRGACIVANGNQKGDLGDLILIAGDGDASEGADMRFQTFDASGEISFEPNGVQRWEVTSTGEITGTSNGSNIIQTSSNSSVLYTAGGNAASDANSGWIGHFGNSHGTRPGDIVLSPGSNAAARVEMQGLFDFVGTMGNSTKSPTTDAPIDWIQIEINGTVGYVPVYAAS